MFKKNSLIILIAALLLTSCNSAKKQEITCAYSINNLFAAYDSNALTISKFQNETDVFDTSDQYHERGIYIFDKGGKLRFYAFLEDDSNNFNCSFEYDSLGNIINRKGGEVTRWFIEKPFNDSSKITFLFYAVNYSYSNVFLEIVRDKIKINGLGKSFHFSNLVGTDWDIPLLRYPTLKTVYISGWRRNLCSGDSTFFMDSVHLPKNLNDMLK